MNKEYHNTPKLTTSHDGKNHKKTTIRKTLKAKECEVLGILLSNEPLTTRELLAMVFTTNVANHTKAINEVFRRFAYSIGNCYIDRVITSKKTAGDAYRYRVDESARSLLTQMQGVMCADCTEDKS